MCYINKIYIEQNTNINESNQLGKRKAHQIVAGGEVVTGESTGKGRDRAGRESESTMTRFDLRSECGGECDRS